MGTASGQSPFSAILRLTAPAVIAGVDLVSPLATVPFTGVVTKVEYFPVGAITGANTDTRSVSLLNVGQAGIGTTAVATLQFNAAVDAVALDNKAITLSGTPANLNVVEGDVLAWKSLHVGTGIADPGGIVEITLSRD